MLAGFPHHDQHPNQALPESSWCHLISRKPSRPTKIEARFQGNAPAEPKPETFKALYGAFRIDITQRLLGVAKVTKDGILVSDAALPSGKHQLLLTLTDTLGREAQHVVSFTVQ